MSVYGVDGLTVVEDLCALTCAPGFRPSGRATVVADAGPVCRTRVEACLPPHVPVPRPGPCKGWKTPEFRQAQARVRQKSIDDARAKAGVLAELEELVIDEVDGEVLERTMGRVAKAAGLDGDGQIEALVKVARDGGRQALDKALKRQARRFALRRIGGNARTARFDARDHEMIADERRPAAGTLVEIVRPGYDFLLERKPLRLHKAIVQVA